MTTVAQKKKVEKQTATESKDDAPSLDVIGLKYVASRTLGKGKNYTGGDKTSLGHGFTNDYERLFASRRHDPLTLLEIGVSHGKSLAMWCEYFRNATTVFGVDIDLGPYRDAEPELKRCGFDRHKARLFEVICSNQPTYAKKKKRKTSFPVG
jgi:hypothetical protein